MADNTTGFEFNEVPGSPKSKASAVNLNNAVKKALIRNIAANAVKPAHIDPSNAGAGLVGGGGSSLAVNPDGETLEVNSDKVRIKDGGVGSTQIADGAITMDKLADAVKTAIDSVIKGIYKVGDYFITHNAEDPAKRFGGQWELVKDRFLIGAGGDYEILAEGGETKYALPNHFHGYGNYDSTGGSATKLILPTEDRIWKTKEKIDLQCLVARGDEYGINFNWGKQNLDKGNLSTTVETYLDGSNDAEIDVMPPYKAVYIWVKISDEDIAE